jgi:hypothetical protein
MLPKETQSKWVREAIVQNKKEMVRYFLDRDFESMLEFILTTILWETSKDGVTYWGNIAYNEQYK